MNKNTMQEQFEAWISQGQFPDLNAVILRKLPDGTYFHQLTVGAWNAWQAATNLTTIARPEEAIREALEEITTACEKDCGVPSEDDGDDEAVGAGQGEEYGTIAPMALTFGILRRARNALKSKSAHSPAPRVEDAT